MTRTLSLLLLPLLAVAGCARSEEATTIPPDPNQGYNQVTRIGSPEDDDREPAIGQWRAAIQDNVDVLEFGPLGTEPLFSLACGSNRSVILQRHGGVAPGPLPEMDVSRGQANVRLPVTAGGGTVPMVRAEVALDSQPAQIVGQEGDTLTIKLGDGPPLIMPSSALVGQFVRACATARPRPEAGNSAAPAPAPANTAAPSNTAAAAPAANAAQPKQ